MSKKKANKPEESAENQELVRRVDAMMSTELPDEPPARPVSIVVAPDDQKPVPVKTKNQKTAPKLSPKLLKSVEGDEVTKDEVTKLKTPAKPPIVITLADEDKAAEEPAAKPEAEEAAAEPPKAQDKDPLEDSATDKAVDDIVAHEGDTVLAVTDALTARQQAVAQPGRPSGRSDHKWLWLLILIILLGTAADVAIYLSRR